MVPPALVRGIVRPGILILKMKVPPVRAVCADVSPLLPFAGMLIDLLPVKPAVEGSAVVEHTVQDDLHATGMYLAYKIRKVRIRRLQVFLPCRPADIALRIPVLRASVGQKRSFVLHKPGKMRIDVLVILCIILVIGG